MQSFMCSTSHTALFFIENILSPTVECKSRRCLSGMKMRFHYVVSHLFVLLKVWPPVDHTAAGWIKSPITLEPIEVKFGNILAWKIGSCQSDTDGPLSLALTVNHTFPIAIHALLSPLHTHKILSISRRHNSVNISYWLGAACKQTGPTDFYLSHIITTMCWKLMVLCCMYQGPVIQWQSLFCTARHGRLTSKHVEKFFYLNVSLKFFLEAKSVQRVHELQLTWGSWSQHCRWGISQLILSIPSKQMTHMDSKLNRRGIFVLISLSHASWTIWGFKMKEMMPSHTTNVFLCV